MKRAALLLALAAVVGGCASPATSSVASRDAGGGVSLAPSASPATSAAQTPGPAVRCTIPTDVCSDAAAAVEALPALDAAGMPPLAITVTDMGECRAITGAPKGYDPCAAAIPMPSTPPKPGEPTAVGWGDANATVIYRNGLGKAFLYLWWSTPSTGRSSVGVVLEVHNP